jgi:hypothetical protein
MVKMSNTSWANTLAKEFKARNNKEYFGTLAGTVLSVNPIKIGIYDNQIMLDSSNIFVAKTINDLITNSEISINDTVLVISSENNQTFFIIDKLI